MQKRQREIGQHRHGEACDERGDDAEVSEDRRPRGDERASGMAER